MMVESKYLSRLVIISTFLFDDQSLVDFSKYFRARTQTCLSIYTPLIVGITSSLFNNSVQENL